MKTMWMMILLAVSALAQEKLEDVLRKGVVEEESRQNLNGAIQTYQSVLARYERDRGVAATALFRMAESYRKLGKSSESETAYARLVSEFPDQTKLVEASRNRLPPDGNLLAEQAAEKKTWNEIRAILMQQIEIQVKQLERIKQKYQLGAADTDQIALQELRILQLRKELAAFDAGVPWR